MSDHLESIVGESQPLPSPEATQVAAEPETSAAETPAAGNQSPEQPAESKLVPLPALHEERQRRRELQQQLQQERQAREALEKRVAERLEALQQSMTPAERVPSFEENPAENLRHTVGKVQQVAQTTQQQISEWRQQQEAQANVERAANMVRSHEAEFMRENPDYQAAVTFMLESRAREFEALGNDSVSARELAVREMTHGALVNASQGRNPAEIAYRLAKARGYSPQKAAPSDAEKVQMQQRGTQAARSLGTGGAASGKLDVKAVLEMSDEDFAEATKGNKWAKLMGG